MENNYNWVPHSFEFINSEESAPFWDYEFASFLLSLLNNSLICNFLIVEAAFDKNLSYIYTMKWVSFMLCIYFMLLSVMPCSDGEECNAPIQTSISAIDDHGNHSHESEMCSPFCTCLCCGQFVSTASDEASISQLKFHSTPTLAIYQSGFSLEVDLAIWQPPKIS